jgi:AcrR family transcriptional regulator
MKRKLDGSTKDELIQTTLKLIDSNGGASDVNLREIARSTGCSAPNIYNYFSSLDDLMNTVLVEICEDYKRNLYKKAAQAHGVEELLFLAFNYYIQYVMDYPGRMNFYHFEKLNIKVFTETDKSAISVGQTMAGILKRGTDNGLAMDKVEDVGHHIHCYLLGELSEYITGRSRITDKEQYVKDLVAYCRRIYRVLMQHL